MASGLKVLVLNGRAEEHAVWQFAGETGRKRILVNDVGWHDDNSLAIHRRPLSSCDDCNPWWCRNLITGGSEERTGSFWCFRLSQLDADYLQNLISCYTKCCKQRQLAIKIICRRPGGLNESLLGVLDEELAAGRGWSRSLTGEREFLVLLVCRWPGSILLVK